MKMPSLVVAGLGVLALVLGVGGRLLGIQTMMGVTPGGFVRGASALYLLAIVLMLYGRWYAEPASPPSPAKT